ncbi:hypothetical protein Nepgr_001026 [Nepenthes gracilis]|uniref:1,4-alpha-glucan branching enzyme n=1 Tax=Nepenthes gracilis TaxID=150966 RepID=A0AAD3P4L7_NEPGR|nr:hypothetical protein Nepgr_001026 [Nepenthes gracilis]
MPYHHHGINTTFTGAYNEYFSEATAVATVVYLMMASSLIHNILRDATVIAENVSGTPGLCRSVSEGGNGFDYCLAMAIPNKWIDYLKNKKDDDWSMKEITWSLTNRGYPEKCTAYAESHDQTIVEGGEGYLNFMGNECGHPERIDFPREGNEWSYDKCRRQWILGNTDHLRYKFRNAFDPAMRLLDEEFSSLSSSKQIFHSANEEDKIIVFERGELAIWVRCHLYRANVGPHICEFSCDFID